MGAKFSGLIPWMDLVKVVATKIVPIVAMVLPQAKSSRMGKMLKGEVKINVSVCKRIGVLGRTYARCEDIAKQIFSEDLGIHAPTGQFKLFIEGLEAKGPGLEFTDQCMKVSTGEKLWVWAKFVSKRWPSEPSGYKVDMFIMGMSTTGGDEDILAHLIQSNVLLRNKENELGFDQDKLLYQYTTREIEECSCFAKQPAPPQGCMWQEGKAVPLRVARRPSVQNDDGTSTTVMTLAATAIAAAFFVRWALNSAARLSN
jgi:hypothetical protein